MVCVRELTGAEGRRAATWRQSPAPPPGVSSPRRRGLCRAPAQKCARKTNPDDLSAEGETGLDILPRL